MRPRDDRGSVLPVVATMVTVLVLIAAFAVDIGVQRSARRDMQALADIVALDLARLVDGRTAAQIRSGAGGKPTLETAKSDSFARNNDTLVGDAPSGCGEGACIRAYLVDVDDKGGYPEQNGVPQEVADGALPDAVVVVANTEVGFAFGGVVGVDKGSASRRALATTQSNACFRLGSFAAGLKSADSALLSTLIGNALDFKSISYTGLADAKVSLGGLAAELGAVSPSALMDTNVSIARLAEASANVLQRESGGVVTAQVTALRQLAASTKVQILTVVDLGELMELSTAGSAALTTKVNVIDLIAGAAFLANGTNGIKTGVIWNLPAISHTEIELIVSEAPQLACGEVGKAVAKTGQLSYSTTLTYQRGNNIAGLEVMTQPILTIYASVARAEGTLTEVRCGAATLADPEGMTVHVLRDAPILSFDVPVAVKGEVGIEKYTQSLSGLLGSLGYTVLQIADLLANLNKLKIELDLQFNLGSAVPSVPAEGDVVFNHPPTAYETAVPVPGRSPAAIPHVAFTRAEIRGSARLIVNGTAVGSPLPLDDIDLDFLVSAVLDTMIGDTINPLIDKVNSVITPMSDALGVTLSGADLFALPRPTCNAPKLIG